MEKPIFSQTFPVCDLHTDRWGRMKPSAILYLCQEAAGGHCKELGLDWESLAKRNMFWALIRTKVDITQLPVLGQNLCVKTWPMPTTRTAFPRATEVCDENGNLLLRSTSLWVLMDPVSRSMILPGKSGVELNGSLLGSELPAPGSLHPVQGENTQLRPVRFSELDRNGHMNNTRYMDWVFDLLPGTFHQAHPCKGFTVCYLSEAKEDQDIQLTWTLDSENRLHMEATRSKEDVPDKWERVFAVETAF